MATATAIQTTKTIQLPWMDEESIFASDVIPEHSGRRFLFHKNEDLLSFYINFTDALPAGGQMVTRLSDDGLWVVDVVEVGLEGI